MGTVIQKSMARGASLTVALRSRVLRFVTDISLAKRSVSCCQGWPVRKRSLSLLPPSRSPPPCLCTPLLAFRHPASSGGDSKALLNGRSHVWRKRRLACRPFSNRATDDAKESQPVGESEASQCPRGASNDCSCWKCGSSLCCREFFCGCGVAQLLDERLDYFEMFGSSRSVFMDVEDLERKFKNMQRAFHPVSSCGFASLVVDLPPL